MPAVTRKFFRRLTSSLARAVYAQETNTLGLLLEAMCQAGSEAKSRKDPSREASVGSRKERSGAAWPGYRRPLSARRPPAVCFLTGGGRIERSLVLLAVSGELSHRKGEGPLAAKSDIAGAFRKGPRRGRPRSLSGCLVQSGQASACLASFFAARRASVSASTTS